MESLKLIGNTPIVNVENNQVAVKLEKFNLGGSIKDRAVLGMLNDAMNKNLINKDSILIEATSGNTGIALALIGSLYKLKVVIVMPETMSNERRQLVKAYGAKLILSKGSEGMNGAIKLVNSMMKENSNYISLNQFNNPANVNIHYETTGQEIIKQVPDVDMFVATVGTGGTYMGISKALKEYNSNIKCYAGEPTNSNVLSGGTGNAHAIQGIGAGFIPSIIDFNYIDDIMLVDDEEALNETVNFVKETGVFVGISSGANIALARRLAKENPGKKIVTIAPDGGEKYLSVLNFEVK
ncbi:MAG: cysteine synthase family protein [Erysipelotrichaceae bacterium]